MLSAGLNSQKTSQKQTIGKDSMTMYTSCIYCLYVSYVSTNTYVYVHDACSTVVVNCQHGKHQLPSYSITVATVASISLTAS